MKKRNITAIFTALVIMTACVAEAYYDGEKAESAMKINIKINGGKELTATLFDNATTRALVEKLPLTVQLADLYSREMCYHFPDELPTDDVRTTGYEVGEIIYWPPRHSFVIMYAQNGERFDMQKLGRIDFGVGVFEGKGNVTVTISTME
jgi:hypothetical protein